MSEPLSHVSGDSSTQVGHREKLLPTVKKVACFAPNPGVWNMQGRSVRLECEQDEVKTQSVDGVLLHQALQLTLYLSLPDPAAVIHAMVTSRVFYLFDL